MASKQKQYELMDALEMVQDGDDSELSDLSSDEDEPNDATYVPPNINVHLDDNDRGQVDPSEEENDPDEEGNEEDKQQQSEPDIQPTHISRWRKKDIPVQVAPFQKLIERRDPEMTPLDYFRLFWTEELSDLIADNTNLYSTQKIGIFL